MDKMVLRAFQRHVADQCRFALYGVDLISTSLPVRDDDTLWIGCQQFLVGSANVSKALWGQAGKLSSQRSPLRRSLQVADDSALRGMTFRNHFEHYDERIDRWWAESPNHMRLDQVIGSPASLRGFEGVNSFRVYDPGSHTIHFWGEEFPVEPIAREITRL